MALTPHTISTHANRYLLRTPVFLKSWVSNMGIGAPPSVQEQQQRGAFRGRGMRLGAN
jgi:hypothetical protein